MVTSEGRLSDADESGCSSMFETLFMSISDGFYLSETLYNEEGYPNDYRFLEVNPRFERILGLPREQIIGKRFRELVPADNTRWMDVYCQVARTGNPMSYEFYSSEYRMHFETYSYRIREGRVCVLVRNVTERKKMEEALNNAQRLESLGVLAGGIAHDFNNLMTGIYGFLDLARLGTREEKTRVYLNMMYSTLDRARALTNQLLTFGKGGAPVRIAMSLVPFVEDTAKFALSGSKSKGAFKFPPGLWPCYLDKNQIAQVIDNMVINADQAMPGGGTVEIEAENVRLSSRPHLLLEKGDYVKLTIRDSGTGIPADVLPHIFDLFYTTKPGGHGLGLATCFSIIKRHRGGIEVESEKGKGSAFHIYLSASGEPAAVKSFASGIHKGQGTILVVDDEYSVREMLRGALESMGYGVVCRKEGQEALLCYHQFEAGCGLAAIFCDLTIPGGMGGMDFIAEIRKRDKTVPVFVISGYSENAVMKNPAEYGFRAGLFKPFTVGEVSELLNTFLSGAP